jgi:hypothetical protein
LKNEGGRAKQKALKKSSSDKRRCFSLMLGRAGGRAGERVNEVIDQWLCQYNEQQMTDNMMTIDDMI